MVSVKYRNRYPEKMLECDSSCMFVPKQLMVHKVKQLPSDAEELLAYVSVWEKLLKSSIQIF